MFQIFQVVNSKNSRYMWTASSEFGTYSLCEQRRFRRTCACAQSRHNLRCSLIQAVSQEEPSDRKPDPWPLWMAGHAQLKFVMTECSKTQIRLTGLVYFKDNQCGSKIWIRQRSQWKFRFSKWSGKTERFYQQTFYQFCMVCLDLVFVSENVVIFNAQEMFGI